MHLKNEFILYKGALKYCLGRFLGISDQKHNVSKSNWLYLMIFQGFFTNLRYILKIPLKWPVASLRSWTLLVFLAMQPVHL